MSSRREILQAHYRGILRKAATWAGLFALMSTMFVSVSADAAQITARKAAVGNSKGAASTSYLFTFTPTATLIRSVKFQICDSPLQLSTCTAPTGASMAGGSFTTGAPTASPFNSGWATGTSGLAPTATSFWIVNGTGSTPAASPNNVQLTAITNPTAANLQYYARIYTYSDAGATTLVDYGAMALATGNEMTVAANVQESLNFTVGQTGTCGSISGTTVNIGTNPGTDNVLQLGTATAGTSVMCVNTNASGGYTISYISNSTSPHGFTNGTYTMTDSTGGSTFASAVSGGTDLFGINVVANNGGSSGPTAGSAVSGGVAPTGYGTGYGTANTYAFTRNAVTNLVSETTGPTANTLFTVTYAAVAGNSTPTGAYQVKMNYIATGTF